MDLREHGASVGPPAAILGLMSFRLYENYELFGLLKIWPYELSAFRSKNENSAFIFVFFSEMQIRCI